MIQAPAGASLEYTKKIGEQVNAVLRQQKEVESVFAISGFSFSGTAGNRALVFATMRPYSKRRGDEHTAAAVINRIRGPLFGISGALVFPFPPPAVQGLGQFGGFQYELQDQGGHTLEELANATQAMVRQGNSPGTGLTGLLSTYTANDPQFLSPLTAKKPKVCTYPCSRLPIPLACTWAQPM